MAAAGYYRDTEKLDDYKKKNPFLASLNNEVGEGSSSFAKHKQRISSLNAAMFVMFDRDEIIFPRES